MNVKLFLIVKLGCGGYVKAVYRACFCRFEYVNSCGKKAASDKQVETSCI